jgi:hypothetical protein
MQESSANLWRDAFDNGDFVLGQPVQGVHQPVDPKLRIS